MSSNPKVSIGLPVCNGENYIADAITSTLAQSFGDFELVISDNASTDDTGRICQEWAGRDRRIRYQRLPQNLGAAPNFNRVLDEARGEYFRWAAHDDTVEPEYLARCVAVLDADPEVVLCHSRVRVVDQSGGMVEEYQYRPQTDSPDPRRRFYDLLFVPNRCYEVFGLIRRSALARTGKMGSFPVGDRVLLSELAFQGRFHEIPETLFTSRDHSDRSVRRLVTQQERAPWFDARYAGKITFPEWRTLAEYWKAIQRSTLPRRDRLWCELYLLKWIRHYRKRMRRDLMVAAGTWLIRAGDKHA